MFSNINCKCSLSFLRRNVDILCSLIPACCQCSLFPCLICLIFPYSLFNFWHVPLFLGTPICPQCVPRHHKPDELHFNFVILRLAKPCQMHPSSNGSVVSKNNNKYYASCPNGTSSFCRVYFWLGFDSSRCSYGIKYGGMTCDKMILKPFPTCVNDCKSKFFILFYQYLI